MKRSSEHSPILETSQSGSAVQVGRASSFTSVDSSTYAGISAHARSLIELFCFHDLNYAKSPSLKHLIELTNAMSDSWDRGSKDEVTLAHLIAAAQVERIATAALSITNCTSPAAVFRSLLNGSLDLLGRQQSKAKDTLWELELLRILMRHAIDARLEEPDLVVSFSGAPVGLACKKIYSEGNVSKVLSNAVAQIEREGDFGIIALNIDDLLPANAILKAPSIEVMSAMLEERNNSFLSAHERHFRRYLTPGRAISALVSCGTIADVEQAENRFMNARQTTVWQIPGIPEAKAEQMNHFLAAMNEQYPA